MDKLEEIFAKQFELQMKLGYTVEEMFSNIDYIKTNVLAVESELQEFLRETPWKPWKQQQEWNIKNMKAELIDMLHFFVNLCIAAGMTAEELYKKYLEKREENIKRQEEGY